MDFAEIRRLLPHRYPILLVDRVREIVPGERIVASKAVTGNEPWFAGKDTDRPVCYPQVLLIESWGQSAVILALSSNADPENLRKQNVVLAALSGAQFHRPVLPGDVVENHVTLSHWSNRAVIFEGWGSVAGQVVFEIERMVLAFRSATELHAS